ncbi:BET domain-containing protein [Sporobolomyces koalae]|uniref:BET domain-containing protein n=1 Tax=Sporobolomyces koalae TaxID=500713 RepID=UPI00316BD2B2
MKPPGGLAISPPSLHTSLPASPSRLIHLKRSSSTEPPSLPSAPIAEAPPSGVDLYRPQGTWREAIGLPPNSVNPVWAFLPAGGGKKKKVPGSGRSLPTSSRKCAGVWMCSSSTCLHIARPIVSSKECLRYCETCRSPMNLISCSARWNVVTLPKIEQGAFAQLVYHEGIHEHVEPPGRGVPSGVSAKVVDLGRQNPSIIPTQSQSGSYSVNSERRQARQPSREVHLSPTTSSNSASPLQQARETSGTPDSDSQSDASEGQNMVALDILAELARANPNTFGGLVIDGGIILMNLQSPKMRERLNSSRAGLETSGRHGRPGLATDAHNTFFNKPYILIQTVMFSDSTSRWLPVLYTVTDRETAEAYERHFTALFEAFDIDFRPEKIAAQFMHADDFSSAQSEGFVTALAQFAEASYTRQRKTGGEVSVQDRNSYYEQGLFEAQRLVKGGCGQFDLDIAQAARQFRIPDSERVEFVQSAYLVVMSNTVAAIQAQRSKMLARWPIMMRWFGWWTASRIARLTGASQTGTSPEDLVAIPSDSNAVEHTNMVVLQMSRGEKLTLEVGLGRLYDLIQAYDAQESAANTVVDSEMKRELAHKLVMFEGEKLQEAINIIRRGQPDALRASNHKLDIDIDILDRRTLVALYRYVCPGIQCGTTLLKVGR